MKRLIFLLITCMLLTSGCASAAIPAGPGAAAQIETTVFPITVTDSLGTTITLAAPAARIISLAPSNTEILFAVGAGLQIAGREELSDYPAEANQIASIGSAFGAINTEAIVALQPDLILAADTTTPEQISTLQNLGLTVFRLGNPKDFDGLYANLATVGELTGHAKEASDEVHSLRQRVAAVQAKVKGDASRPEVFYEMDASDPAKPWTAGPGSFVDTLITMAGGQNTGSALKEEWAQMSAEDLILRNPDIILLGSAAYGVTTESVKQRAGWQAIAAVHNGAIYPVNDTIVTRPGPRLVDALELFAKLLHPELFS